MTSNDTAKGLGAVATACLVLLAACGGENGLPGPASTLVDAVIVTPATGAIAVQDTLRLTATTKDARGNMLTGRTVSWTSKYASVATVATTGLVTGVSEGSAIILVTAEGRSGQATILVVCGPGLPPFQKMGRKLGVSCG